MRQAAFAEGGLIETFHVGKEVTILGVSLFVLGLGMGPLVVGPLSEIYGRNWVYRISYGLFFAFSWAVAFPPHIGLYSHRYTCIRMLTAAYVLQAYTSPSVS